MFTAPFQGWGRVLVRQRRTAVDWAEEVKYILDEVYPDAVRVTLVCNNLNTHKLASFYKHFRLMRRVSYSGCKEANSLGFMKIKELL